MARLTELLQAGGTSHLPWGHELTLAELLREQGRFEEARACMATISNEQDDYVHKLISKLIEEREPGPMRYRV